MMLVILCVLTGLVLGQRFTVLVLVPAALLIMALSIDVGGVRPDFRAIAFSAAVVAVSLQAGYLLGTAIASLVEGFRDNRVLANGTKASSPTRQPVQ